MLKILIPALVAALVSAGCGTTRQAVYKTEFGEPLLNEPVNLRLLDGIWAMSFSPLEASEDSNNQKPCIQIASSGASVKVINSSVMTWHYGGRGYVAPINQNGIFTFSRSSGYAYSFPGTKDRMPQPVIVTIMARITEDGIGTGSIVYDDKNDEYARCGGPLAFKMLAVG